MLETAKKDCSMLQDKHLKRQRQILKRHIEETETGIQDPEKE